jgi:lecithin:retinol acyltransferase
MYPMGTVLKLDFGTFFHYGVADGLGSVIHNSKKHLKVTQESYEAFSEGKEIIVSDITSDSPPNAAIKAQRYIGMPYNLMHSNCEHFARLCHGLEEESTQIQQYFLAALGAGAVLKSNNAIIQAAGGAVALASLLTPTEESPFQNAAIAALIAAGLVALARA